MPGDIAHVIGAVDAAVGCDQVAVPASKVGELVVGVACDVVGLADSVIEVAEQSEREALRLREVEVLCRRVERCTEDDDTEFVEAIGPVTQRLSLDRSTRRRGLGVPPQQHPMAEQIGAVDDLAVLIGQGERRSFGSW